jgi:hypothetical protein
MNIETIKGQRWVDIRYTQDKKYIYLVINGVHMNHLALLLPANKMEELRKEAESLRTFSPLCFEYPTKEDGSIDFF